MSSPDLRKLWKLNQVDTSIVEIRQRAASLDPGRRIQAEIDALNKDYAEKSSVSKRLSGEQADAELQQKTIDEKLKRIEKDLYGGKVVNPREVEAYEKETLQLKRQRGELDLKLLQIWEELPPAKKLSDEAEAKLEEKKKELVEYQKKVVQYKAQLEKEFKELSAKRPELVKEIPAPLLSRYDAVRQKQGGIAMAEVLKGNNCSACGTHLPEKNVELAREGKIVTCESCHRILYARDGLL